MDKLKVIFVQKELLRQKVFIFSLIDFVRLFKTSPKTARAFLSYHTKKELFLRLKRGIYLLSNNLPTKFEIANYLWKPSYISFETALSFYGMIPETVYTIISTTTGVSKEFKFQNQIFQYYQIKKKLFFGYRPFKIQNKIVLFAEPEKALLDYLYLSSLKKQPINERLDLTKIDKNKLGRYVAFFEKNIRKNRALIALIKQLQI